MTLAYLQKISPKGVWNKVCKTALCVWCVFLHSQAHAEEGFEESSTDDIGFAAPPSPQAPVFTEEKKPSAWSVGGFLRSDWALWSKRVQHNPFAKARQNADMFVSYKTDKLRLHLSGHAEWDPSYYVEKSSYDTATLDAYLWRVLLKDSYVSTSQGPFEFSFGRQTVNWGEGDVLSPVDVVNPRDMREPGLADLDDIRMPVLMTRIGFFKNNHRLEWIGVHENHFGWRSPPMGPFSPFPYVIAQNPAAQLFLSNKDLFYTHTQPMFSWATQQGLARWSYKGPSIDTALYAASVLDTQGVMSFPPANTLLTTTNIPLSLDHKRYHMLGHSGSLPWKNWLLKWEFAYDIQKPLTTLLPNPSGLPVLSFIRAQLLTAMAGVSYQGFSQTTIAIETSHTFALSSVSNTVFPVNIGNIAFRANRTFLRERVHASIAANAFGWDLKYGFLARAEVAYMVQDALRVSVGYITYQPGKDIGPLAGFTQHDRLFTKIRWDF